MNMMFSLTFILLIFLQSVYTLNVGDSCTIKFNRQRGVCRLIRECSAAKEDYDKNNVSPTRCGFDENGSVIVCCRQTQFAPTRVNSNTAFNPSSSKRVSERKCDEYSQSVKSKAPLLGLSLDSAPNDNTVGKCEYGNTGLIVGGVPVQIGEIPHMAAIGWELVGGRGYDWKCGGSLISENYVLTAGHCTFTEGTDIANDGQPSIVRLGEFDLTSTRDDANVQNINIQTIITHTDYKLYQKYDDIALLKLASSAKLGKFVRPACLWTKSNFEDVNAMATGWGLTTDGGSSSSVLQKVVLNIMEQSLCSSIYKTRKSYRNGIIDSQFCAGVLEGGKDTCEGDSGGPLQVRSKSNNCIYYIIGLTSFGRKCGQAGSGGVYTKISKYVDWIENTVWPNEK